MSDEFFPPKDRVCYKSFLAKEFQEDVGDDIGIDFHISGSPTRLYDGDTSNEGNFVGYGVNFLSSMSQAGGNVFFQSDFGLASVFNFDEGFADTAEYVDVNGIHLLAAFIDFDENPGAIITITESSSEVKCVASDGASGTETFIVDKPFDFYTYP